MFGKTVDGILAGVMICVGGCVFLGCENRYVAAVFFSVALLCVCMRNYSLFTGKVGYIPEKRDKEAVSTLLCGLLGNALMTCAGGSLFGVLMPNLRARALDICSGKLTQSVPETFVRALFCGVLMYMAVSLYREKKTTLGIFFCVPAFILAGFEHSIADMFYFGTSGMVSLHAFGYLWLVIVGNAVGGMLMPILERLRGTSPAEQRKEAVSGAGEGVRIGTSRM